MSKIATGVQLAPDVLAGVDALARLEGRTRDDVIEDSVRRTVAHRTLHDVLLRSRSRSSLSQEAADELAADERRAARTARQDTSAAP